MPRIPIVSIEKWAADNGVQERTAYRWAKTGKLPTVTRKVSIRGVPSNITVKDVVNFE